MAAGMDDERDLRFFGKKPQTSVNLQALMETGQGGRLQDIEGGGTQASKDAQMRVLIQIACFLHRELPVRLAHRALELENTEDFKENAQFHSVCTWYKQSFAALRACPAPIDKEKEELFAKCVMDIYERHANTLITMALGAHHLRKQLDKSISDFSETEDIQQRLDEFYMSRIGVRMLIGQ
jgi:pyruvate dehydrogenase kinase 2/3/4